MRRFTSLHKFVMCGAPMGTQPARVLWLASLLLLFVPAASLGQNPATAALRLLGDTQEGHSGRCKLSSSFLEDGADG